MGLKLDTVQSSAQHSLWWEVIKRKEIGISKRSCQWEFFLINCLMTELGACLAEQNHNQSKSQIFLRPSWYVGAFAFLQMISMMTTSIPPIYSRFPLWRECLKQSTPPQDSTLRSSTPRKNWYVIDKTENEMLWTNSEMTVAFFNSWIHFFCG